MKILHVNTADRPGGAEVVACNLVEGLRRRGHQAWLAAGEKKSEDDFVIDLREKIDPFEKIRASLIRHYRKRRGHEIFHSPISWRLPEIAPEPPDILHAHNLHGLKGYFDLRALPSLSARFPFFLTLQDSWLLSGHCGHSFDCDRWKTGCGQCPDLTIYPSVRRDATDFNWHHKRELFARSRLFVATPCQWLMDKVEDSILAEGIVESRIIPNGVDLKNFHPADRAKAREELNLPHDAFIVLFAGSALKENPFKDPQTLRETIARVSDPKVLFVAIGAESTQEFAGNARVRFTGFLNDHKSVAKYFNGADCFLHPARADTFPNVVLEAAASGCPVIASAVAGIPEQIAEGKTGFLVARGDSEAMAARVIELSAHRNQPEIMGAAAAELAAKKFGLETQIDQYLQWYSDVLQKAQRPPRIKRIRPALPFSIPRIVQLEPSQFTATAIVSTYNSEEFIRGCLEDLVTQTLFAKDALEILVIDSGSPKNERAIVQEFMRKFPNIVYVRTEREPLYAAWNRAIPLARGRYLTNANTDDRHRKDALEVMARALDDRPDVAIVYGDMVMTSEPNKTFETARQTKLFRWKNFCRLELLGDQRCGPQPMWRKELHLEFGGFCEEFKVASDYEWWLRVAEKYPLLRIPEPLGLYLKRPDSIEHRQLEICEKETELIQRFYRARMPGFDPKLISQRPKKALPRFFWRMRRSIRKRLTSN